MTTQAAQGASDRPSFYITTAIAYPNARPHMGTAYEYVTTDVLARFKRLDGYDVRHLTGTDEHGIKMMQAADRAGLSPADFARDMSDRFEELQRGLGVAFDRFIRTTDADHIEASQAIWRAMEANGDIYLGGYQGWYSVRDEAYYNEDETHVGDDGVRVATSSGTEVTWTEEPSYFFRLSQYGDRLLDYYAAHPEFIGPEFRRNEMESFIKQGLRDLSISRSSFDWGVPVPGDPAHVMYVWVDALTNYITGVGYPDVESESFRRYWPADVHIIGKDITRFHTLYWPAFLMSAGIELPQRVFIHGFLYDQGKKLSKSDGGFVDPLDFAAQYGLDQMRYFLCREFTYGNDGSYSHDAVVTRINADLANELGNLAQRSLSMVAKNLDGVVPTPGDLTEEDRALVALLTPLLDVSREHIDGQQLSRYLESLWEVLAETNRYFSAQQPWVLRTSDPARMATVLSVTLEVVRVVATLVQPVMPTSAGRLLALLGLPEQVEFAELSTPLVPGTPLPAPTGVFPRYLDPPS
jgi:methionyl-tRNA synthetase